MAGSFDYEGVCKTTHERVSVARHVCMLDSGVCCWSLSDLASELSGSPDLAGSINANVETGLCMPRLSMVQRSISQEKNIANPTPLIFVGNDVGLVGRLSWRSKAHGFRPFDGNSGCPGSR